MADNNSSNTGAISFTEGETALVVAIMKHLTSEVQFDAEAIAAELGYKDGSIVKTRWRQIKTKKLCGAAGSAGSPNDGGVKKRTPASRKATKKTNVNENGPEGDDEEVLGEGTPSKTPKKRGRKPKADKVGGDVSIKAEEGEGVVESTETEV